MGDGWDAEAMARRFASSARRMELRRTEITKYKSNERDYGPELDEIAAELPICFFFDNAGRTVTKKIYVSNLHDLAKMEAPNLEGAADRRRAHVLRIRFLNRLLATQGEAVYPEPD